MVAEQAGARDQIWQFSAFSERRNPSLHRTSTPIFAQFEPTGLIQLQQNHLLNKNRDVCVAPNGSLFRAFDQGAVWWNIRHQARRNSPPFCLPLLSWFDLNTQ